MGPHPLHGQRHRGQRIQPDALAEQLRAAARLREHFEEDRRSGQGISTDYTGELAAYVERYSEHWARVLDASPFDFRARSGSVGAGWSKLFAELDGRLSAIDPGYHVERVHEKYGELRVDVLSFRGREAQTALDALTDEFESRSAEICELCGQPRRLRQ